MKNIKYLIFLIAIALINCERDDICAESTPTTPRLLIEFYDAENPDDLLNVPRLTVYGDGMFTDENGVVTEPTVASDKIVIDDPEVGSYLFNVNTNAIELPLIVGAEGELITTRFVLEKDTNLRLDDNGESNIDIIEITYTTEFVYVSRACGYKSIFNDLILSFENDGDVWIGNIEVVETTIENENSVHVRIFY